MLQSIREKSQGWLAWLIVLTIGITFALFGVRSYLQNPHNASSTAAKVNGQSITQEQLHAAFERLRQQRQMQLGAEFTSNPQIDAQLKTQALNQLIVSDILSSAATKQGFRVTENEVNNMLSSMPIFQVKGQFSRDRFREILASTMYTENNFLAALNKDLLISQVQSAYIASAFALPNEVETLIHLISQKRDIAYFTIPKEIFLKDIYVAESDAQTFYNKNQTQFTIPEQVNLDYIELSLPDIIKSIQLTPQQVQQFYDENKESFIKPARWKIASIFIRTPPQTTSKQIQEAQSKINMLTQRLHAGENFSELAEQFSEDPPSAQAGGVIGWITQDNINSELAQSITSLKPGEISEPIKTSAGLSIVKILEFQKEELPVFNQIKDQVSKTLAQQQAQKIFAEKVDKLTNLTYANPNTLNTASKELNLTIKHTINFGPQGGKEGIAANPKIINAAFNPNVLVQGNNSDIIELDSENYIVLRVNHHQPISIKPYANVKKEIVMNLKSQAAVLAAKNQGQHYIKQIQLGNDPKQIAAQNHLTWVEKQKVSRFDTKFNSIVLSTAFRMPRPKESKMSLAGITAPSGDYVVMIVNHVHDDNNATLSSPNKREQLIFKEQLENNFGTLDYGLYTLGLEKKAKVILSQT
ncbi:MAG: hypothetical protein ACD_44C00041G0003 [uncultured bacterium]|nr:MAG: hypothetical protein ACD_44C00041G0003 [uncultured bacterium]OGT16598.1 MAG: hypothetical protein A3B69_04010 [Gammaproteobacteria bacterium RIFCSPHIGHO2_02_FULL_38_33]OGT24879.1 MAG: hypothetical protein A2W47_07495 [Gammaproteobacteria bacterium RIFCSPHIGHO2_12_38_15]OGT76469.1 MAG: hypothetical protein A3G71_05610 [Gammaproteobacteria bacterium RIFCSPLOWO2_12_FULL_38_14]